MSSTLRSGCAWKGPVHPGCLCPICTSSLQAVCSNHLSLPFPAPPGPHTRPRTSWRTSAICLMIWPTNWTQCWTEACSLFPFPPSALSVMGEERICAKWCLQVPPAAPSLHLCTSFASLLGMWIVLLTPHVTTAAQLLERGSCPADNPCPSCRTYPYLAKYPASCFILIFPHF